MSNTYLSQKLFLGLTILVITASHATNYKNTEIAEADNFIEAFRNGEPYLTFRARHENINNKNVNINNGNVLTVQTKLAYETLSYYQTLLFLEITHVSAYLTSRYNSGFNNFNKNNYARVYDSKGANLSNFYFENNFFDNTIIRLGRQSININDGKLVSSEEFRQYNRNYNALSIHNNSLDNLKLFYAFVTTVNGPNSNISIIDRFDTHHHIFNINWHSPWGEIATYYLLFKDYTNSYNSTGTYGIDLNGKRPIDYDINLEYLIRVAQQKGRFNRSNFTANHLGLELSAGIRYLKFKAGLDFLSGNKHEANKYFRTPLGDKHKYLGWANIFLNTPHKGIKDLYCSINGKIINLNFEVIYHNFRLHQGHNRRIGHEIDFASYKTFYDTLSLRIEYAKFSASHNNFNYDSQRHIWFTIKYVI